MSRLRMLKTRQSRSSSDMKFTEQVAYFFDCGDARELHLAFRRKRHNEVKAWIRRFDEKLRIQQLV